MLEVENLKRKSKIHEENREIRYREFAEKANCCETRKAKQFTVTDVKTYLLWKPWAEP